MFARCIVLQASVQMSLYLKYLEVPCCKYNSAHKYYNCRKATCHDLEICLRSPYVPLITMQEVLSTVSAAPGFDARCQYV